MRKRKEGPFDGCSVAEVEGGGGRRRRKEEERGGGVLK